MLKTPRKLRLALIFGGRSGEHEVSLQSALSVMRALDKDHYSIVQIGITHSGAWLVGENVLEAFLSGQTAGLLPAWISPDPSTAGLFALRPTTEGPVLNLFSELDVVFPLVHGTFGEDGTLQGLFELADLPYVGAGVVGSALGMDKGVFKDVMRANDIPVVEYLVIKSAEFEHDPQQVLARAEQVGAYPLYVKPANLGSSVGISRCTNRSDLMEGLLEASRFDRRLLVEHGVNGREIEVSVLGNDQPQVSIPGEILPSREFYSYEAKYVDGTSGLLIPAPLSTEQTALVQALALKAYQLVDCAGMARADFLLDKDNGRLYLNEINTIPGFTRISMYPKLWEASGIPYSKLLDRLVELAFERKAQSARLERRYRREE